MLHPCADHIHRTQQHLCELAKLYDECAHLMAPSQGGSIRERVTGSRSLSVMNDGMMETRSSIHTALCSWTTVLCQEKGIREVPPAVPNMVRFLTSHLSWFVTLPSWTDFSQELNELVTEVNGVVNGAPQEPVLLGPCIQMGCHGCITLSVSGPAYDRRQEVICDRGHQWLPHQWLLLKERIDNVIEENGE